MYWEILHCILSIVVLSACSWLESECQVLAHNRRRSCCSESRKILSVTIRHETSIKQANFKKIATPGLTYGVLSVTALIGLVNLTCDLGLWPFRFTGYPCDGFYPANYGLPRPFHSRIRSRHATDRQMDRHRHHFIRPLPMEVGL